MNRPPASQFEVEVAQEDTIFKVQLAGEFDLAVADRVREAIRQAEQTDAATILIDIDGLRFIDSTGLAALVDAARHHEDGRLRVTRGRGHVAEMLRLTALDQSLPFA